MISSQDEAGFIKIKSKILKCWVENTNKDDGELTLVHKNSREEECVLKKYYSLPKLGYLNYEPEKGVWSNVRLDDAYSSSLTESGYCDFGSNCGDASLYTKLVSGIEMVEIEEFYVSANAKKINNPPFIKRKLTDLVEESFFLVERFDGIRMYRNTASLIRNLNSRAWCSIHQLVPLIDEENRSEFKKRFVEFKIEDLREEYCEEALLQDLNVSEVTFEGHKNIGVIFEQLFSADDIFCERGELMRDYLEGALGASVEIEPDVLVLGMRHGAFSVDLVEYLEMSLSNQSDTYYHPWLMIGLKIRKDVSKIWLLEYLRYAEESGNIIQNLFREWENLSKHLATVEIHMPSSKNAQTADALERRLARDKYLEALNEAMAVREPFNKQKVLYRKRIQAAKGLHNDLLDDIYAQNNPIPYFLEYPYRAFKRERDKLQKIKSSWHLLDILSKVPLYFIIEELLHNNHLYGDQLLAQLESTPASNGTLISLLRTVIKDIPEFPNYHPTVFFELMTAFENGSGLEQIISKRNRLNHSPFDESGFLQIMEHEIHDIVTLIRNALSGIQFIVPLSMKFEKGKKIVSAENICSTDAIFERIEFETILPLEAFPNEIIIAYRPESNSVVFLNTLFTTNLIQNGWRDFGLFDRIDKHQSRQYTFLRSD